MPPDFSGHSLQNRSFQGQDLAGANFCGADIRSADFSGSILTGADFSHSKAGVSHRSSAIVVAIALFLSVITAFFSVQIGPMEIVMMQSGKLTAITASWMIIIMLPIFTITTIKKGLGTALTQSIVSFFAAMTIPLFLAWAGVANGSANGAFAGIAPGAIAVVIMLAGAGVFAIAISLAGLISVGWALIATAIGIFFILASMAGGLGFIAAFVADSTRPSTEALTQKAWSNPDTMPTLQAAIKAVAGSDAFAGLAILIGAGTVAGLGCYLGWRILAGDERYSALRLASIRLCASKGTRFNAANLVDATFTQAIIKGTDFREAKLTRTCWSQSQGFAFSLFRNSELEKAHIRDLLTTRQGGHKNFDRQNLSGLNLRGVNFKDTHLINTDLSSSDLQQADLSGAILVRAQLDTAKLTGAKLTGACIEDWSITKTTEIQGITCEYIYLQWVDEDKRDRLPIQGEFKTGEFVQFLQTLRNTIDLYHQEAINPRAAVMALSELSKEYGESLEILVLEQRPTTTNAVIKLKIPNFARDNDAAIQKLKADYSEQYHAALGQTSLHTSAFVHEIDQITQLLEEGKHRPIFTINNLENNRGIVITGGDNQINLNHRTVQMPNVVNDLNRPIATIAMIDNMSSTHDYTENYRQVLIKLYEAIVNEQMFSAETKLDALEQVADLVVAWAEKYHSGFQQAQNAVYILRGIQHESPDAETFNQICHKLLEPLLTLMRK
jgi:uncharacterized protein YjbI with pentapeptide repeats